MLLEKKINSKISNKLPKEKIEHYRNSKYQMNKDVKVENKQDVEQRQRELVKFMEDYLGR